MFTLNIYSKFLSSILEENYRIYRQASQRMPPLTCPYTRMHRQWTGQKHNAAAAHPMAGGGIKTMFKRMLGPFNFSILHTVCDSV